jgi:hypothetical protein
MWIPLLSKNMLPPSSELKYVSSGNSSCIWQVPMKVVMSQQGRAKEKESEPDQQERWE